MPGTIATTVLMTLLLLGVVAVAMRQHRLLARQRQTLAELQLAKRYQIVVEQANDCIIIVDAGHHIVDINERCQTIYGYGRQEMLAMTDTDLLPPEERAVCSAQPEVAKGPPRLLYETRQQRKDGSIFLGEISQVVGGIEGELQIHKIVRDITERKANEAHIMQMSRLSVTLSAVNHAIAHGQNIEEVFDIACRACVRLGGFKLAWVGLVDKKNNLLRIANSWGEGPDFLKSLLVNTRTDIAEGNCPSAIAFREQRTCICDDFANDPITLPWRDEAARHGIGASVSLPISRDQVPMGVLTAYSDHANSFDERARDLLGEIAESLSFAVHHFAELTAKRETENALKKREMQLLKAEEHAKLGHWEIDLESGEKVWSPQMYQLFERDPADGPVDPDEAYAGYYTPDSARLTQQGVRQAITTGQRVQLEQELHLPNAGIAYHATQLVPIRNEEGRTIALHGTVQDVTEHKVNVTRLARMASRLAQAAREYEDLYQNAPCGYHSLDRDGVIQRINDTELNWLGYTRDEVIGKIRFSDLLPADRAAGFRRSFPLLIESGQLNDLEQNLICKDGSLLPVLINASVIRDESGQFLMSRSTTYNMTERKKVEKEREEYTRRLAQLSRRLVNMQEEERKRLSASLHDRSSPNLAAIGLNLSIIGMPGPKAVSPELAERLEDIRALLDDTTASIREISADLRPPLLDYAGLLPALEGYLYQYSKRTGTATHLECADMKTRPSPELETLLFRIAQEALTNCAKHAAATAIEVSLANDRNGIVLTIRDNGIGFDLEEQGKGAGGIGLGMLNMREMTEFAGGRFIIDSSPGHGTLIRVEM